MTCPHMSPSLDPTVSRFSYMHVGPLGPLIDAHACDLKCCPLSSCFFTFIQGKFDRLIWGDVSNLFQMSVLLLSCSQTLKQQIYFHTRYCIWSSDCR